MKNKVIFFCWMTCLLLLSAGCKDIISVNITEKTPEIIIPSNGQNVTVNPIHFKWEKMEGATKYRLQVVSPAFSNIQLYALDTVISSTDFYFPLDSNAYELKLTALNSGYQSKSLQGVYFNVNSSSGSGTGGPVVLETPVQGKYYKSADQFQKTFRWRAVNNVASYEFYLKRGADFASATTLLYAPNLTLPSLNVDTMSFREGQYHWGVRAYLNGGQETAITKSNFYIDTTRPNTPTCVSPNSYETPGNITFVWDNGSSDPGIVHSPVSSVLEVARDNNFTTDKQTFVVQGNTTVVNLLGMGNIYWRVKNRDEAGNESNYSTTAYFILN